VRGRTEGMKELLDRVLEALGRVERLEDDATSKLGEASYRMP